MNVDFSEVQSHVLLGFKDPHQMLVFFRILQPAAFRAKLAKLAGYLTWTDRELPLRIAGDAGAPKAAIGFAFRGLQNLLSPNALTWLSTPREAHYPGYSNPKNPAFVDDCNARANALLLDPLADIPRWVVGAPKTAPDGVLIIGASTEAELNASLDKFTDELADSIETIHKELGDRLQGHDHFGYLDGVSKPSVDVQDPKRPQMQMRVANNPLQRYSGETLLLTESNPPSDPPMPAWLACSSFLVFRRLRQDVAGFHTAIADEAKRVSQPVADIATRVLGRSVDGHSPVAAQVNPPTDDFDYADDPKGNLCPFAAHVRRANPRNADRSSHRPIFRRSVTYGPRSPSTFDNPQPDQGNVDRGLLFLCYQASIERQFEYVTRNWLNNHDSVSTPIDALLGKQAGKPGVRDISLGQGTTIKLANYVHATGGGYFLVPTRTALERLSAG
jgi:Dyp-type peroxidase family